jgi:hypothetical protein
MRIPSGLAATRAEIAEDFTKERREINIISSLLQIKTFSYTSIIL